MRILVVEDFEPLREALVQGLEEAGYAVDWAGNGEDALRLARGGGGGGGEHDVIVLDLMLPKVDGLTVLRTLRAARSPSHVLILTAKDAPQDRVRGLDLGADDYLVKPFEFSELLARVRALIRRKYEMRSAVVRAGAVEIDTAARRVRKRGVEVELSAREYALLEYLAMNLDRTVSRTEIWQHVYDFNASIESNVVDVYVGLLRKKLEDGEDHRLIQTKRGQGYVLRSGGVGGEK
jgi:DNA-binding response OmpR family regulator